MSDPTPAEMSRVQAFVTSMPRSLRRQKLLAALCRLRLLSPIQPATFDAGSRVWVDLRDPECRGIYLTRYFWPEFPPIVASFLRDGGDLFDVGANFGFVAFGILPLVRGRGIGFHLFEANPRIIPVLERSAGEFRDEPIVINHCCVTDTPGKSYLHQPDGSAAHGFISGRGDPVSNLLLDDYVAKRRIERIAFLKIDVEGWELHALRGAERTLASGKVQAGFVEVAPAGLRRNGADAQDLLDLLDRFGFDSYFVKMRDEPDPYDRKWTPVPINGMELHFAPSSPLPSGFVQGDVMIIHRTSPHFSAVRTATAR